ncbi:MAG: asparagine--tRNA ligase, partial [Chloroflexi bacterium]|nr:asparagine--tRNA ligase [Chloroflexota bacterium]
MPEHIYIQDVAKHVGEEVMLKGWLADKTDKGRLQFLKVRDGTGLIQATVFERDVPHDVFAAARNVSQESSLEVVGIVRED